MAAGGLRPRGDPLRRPVRPPQGRRPDHRGLRPRPPRVPRRTPLVRRRRQRPPGRRRPHLGGRGVRPRPGPGALETGRIRWLGFQPRDEVDRLERTALATVVCSRYETFSSATVESMAMGCPTIAARVGGIAEIIEDGVDGLFHRPEDRDDLAARIMSLLGEPGRGPSWAATRWRPSTGGSTRSRSPTAGSPSTAGPLGGAGPSEGPGRRPPCAGVRPGFRRGPDRHHSIWRYFGMDRIDRLPLRLRALAFLMRRMPTEIRKFAWWWNGLYRSIGGGLFEDDEAIAARWPDGLQGPIRSRRFGYRPISTSARSANAGSTSGAPGSKRSWSNCSPCSCGRGPVHRYRSEHWRDRPNGECARSATRGEGLRSSRTPSLRTAEAASRTESHFQP